MPELDGLDASRRICERWPPESRPHIIAMTANALPEDREACFAAGMDDYVAKPIRAGRAGGGAEARAAGSETVTLVPASERDQPSRLPRSRTCGSSAATSSSPRWSTSSSRMRRRCSQASAARSSAQDTEELRRAAHTLKSNGATLGAAAFAELCRTSSSTPRTAGSTACSQLVDRIEQEYRTLQEALASLRSEPVS